MNLRNYILENKFKVTVLEKQVNIVNYEEIDSFDESKIIIRYKKGTVIIFGAELSISKLLDEELLISGNILKIEFR